MTLAIETWHGKIRALTVKGIPRAQAVSKVADENPALRKLMIAEANANRAAPVKAVAMTARLKAASNPKARTSKSEFVKQVEAMVAEGWNRDEAIRELSLAMGLSKPAENGNYFDRLRQSYRR